MHSHLSNRFPTAISSLLNPPREQQIVEENGREYWWDWIDVYPIPCDEAAERRADNLHLTFLTAWNNQPLHATLPQRRSRRYRILELGSGSGAWTIDMALSRPYDIEVVGVDIFPPITGDELKPAGPQNCRFVWGVDFEGEDERGLQVQDGSFDVVRAAFLAGVVQEGLAVSRVPLLVYLKPGGQTELVEIDWRVNSDDPAPEPCRFHAWYDAVAHASAKAGRPLVGIVDNLGSWLQDVDFSVVRRLPERLDVWATRRYADDKRKKQLVRLHQQLLFEPEVDHLEGMAMRALTQKGWTEAQVRTLCEAARQEIKEESFMLFHTL